MDLWRISNHASLDGEGGRRYSARWHTAGHPVVYLAGSPAGALIEILVHLELSEAKLPVSYKLLRISLPDSVKVSALRLPKGEAWKDDVHLSRKLGDAWIASRRSAVTRVPSVILSDTFNYLLNPLHPDAKSIRIVESSAFKFDPRLLGLRSA